VKKSEVFKLIQNIEDPVKDGDKILSNLHYTHFFMMDSYKKLLLSYDLTFTQANVLGIVNYFSPNSATLEEVKEMVLESNSDVSRTITRLAEKGFVEKMINKENRRKVSIKVTPKGQKTIKKIDQDGSFKRFTQTISLPEAKTFVKVLGKLRESTLL
jgi:DNA-binding MarR family transcriptional regulator